MCNTKVKIKKEEKESLMQSLSEQLVALRTIADISQERLADFVGISRQTYCAVERKSRPMTWSTYLSLIFYFDYNGKTHTALRTMGVFPASIISALNK